MISYMNKTLHNCVVSECFLSSVFIFKAPVVRTLPKAGEDFASISEKKLEFRWKRRGAHFH